jgi:hypothetical protein
LHVGHSAIVNAVLKAAHIRVIINAAISSLLFINPHLPAIS